jgi:hypothetical protein
VDARHRAEHERQLAAYRVAAERGGGLAQGGHAEICGRCATFVMALGEGHGDAEAEREAAIEEWDAALAEWDAVLEERGTALAERDDAIAERDAAFEERNAAVEARDAAIEANMELRQRLRAAIDDAWSGP